MEISELIQKFSDSTQNQEKAIFNSLFILTNRIQTIFDRRITDLSLRQFMLLSTIRQSSEPLSFTEIGKLMGCSRQNTTKLANQLEKKGFVRIAHKPDNNRAACLITTPKADTFFQEDFAPYLKGLDDLFSVYSREEIGQLFTLLMKLYAGVECLESISTDA